MAKHGFEDGSSINEPELSSQSDAIDLELQAGLPPTVESRWGHHTFGNTTPVTTSEIDPLPANS
jgi:hypothetical protein